MWFLESAVYYLDSGGVLCWQATVIYTRQLRLTQGFHSWSTFEEYSSVASVAFPNSTKVHPILKQFLEASEAVAKHSLLAWLPEASESTAHFWVASATSENCAKAHPVLTLFLEAVEVTWLLVGMQFSHGLSSLCKSIFVDCRSHVKVGYALVYGLWKLRSL